MAVTCTLRVPLRIESTFPYVRHWDCSGESVGVNELREVTGTFRDASQARMAVEAARRRGLQTPDPASLPQDADGVHVSVQTAADVEDARRLLLEYGAYAASISQSGTD